MYYTLYQSYCLLYTFLCSLSSSMALYENYDVLQIYYRSLQALPVYRDFQGLLM